MIRLSEDTPAERQAVQCVGKAPYAQPNKAEKRAKIMRRKHDRPFAVYRCNFCKSWHIGSRGE